MNAARTSASSEDLQIFSCFREKSKDDIKESVRFGQMVDRIIEQNALCQKRTDRVYSSLSRIFGEISDKQPVSSDAVSDVLQQVVFCVVVIVVICLLAVVIIIRAGRIATSSLWQARARRNCSKNADLCSRINVLGVLVFFQLDCVVVCF